VLLQRELQSPYFFMVIEGTRSVAPPYWCEWEAQRIAGPDRGKPGAKQHTQLMDTYHATSPSSMSIPAALARQMQSRLTEVWIV